MPIAQVGSTPVNNHQVLRLTLSNGALLEISPNHPTASGAPLSSLLPGSHVDEAQTLAATELVPYKFARTYDILPRSSTGTYFAGGLQLGSTLRPQR